MEEVIETVNEPITYFFPGMGVSSKMYYHQSALPFEKVFFDWMKPLQGENLVSYASRYIEKIDLTKEVNLVGTSFGGVVAIELAKQIKTKKVVIISSMKNNEQLHFVLKIFRYIPLYKLMPAKKPPLNRKIISKMFGITTEKDLDFFINMVSEFDFKYIKWCVGQLIRWKNKEILPNVVSIIGDKDLLFQSNMNNADIVIKGGTHYMVIERFRTVNKHLIDVLGSQKDD